MFGLSLDASTTLDLLGAHVFLDRTARLPAVASRGPREPIVFHVTVRMTFVGHAIGVSTRHDRFGSGIRPSGPRDKSPARLRESSAPGSRLPNDHPVSWDSNWASRKIEPGQDSTSRPPREARRVHLGICTRAGPRSSSCSRSRRATIHEPTPAVTRRKHN